MEVISLRIPVMLLFCDYLFTSLNIKIRLFMNVVIFEVKRAHGKQQEYLDIAVELRPLLQDIDGFI